MTQLFWYPGFELIIDDIVRAENAHLHDSDGKCYVDLESGVWCTSVGHAHPRIVGAIVNQSLQIAHTGYSYTSRIVEQAAGEILALFGFQGGKCVFLCSGSEAVEYGVRIVQEIAERPLLMTMADSYCGAYGSASKKAEGEWFTFDWTACAACPDGSECGADCEHWAAIPFDRIGGFLLEPGSSSGLVRFPPRKLIVAIARTVRAAGGLVLVNEVTTGVGRTGKWFGYEHYGIEPDIVALGKGIGNGYPVSVTAVAPTAADRLGGEPIRYAQSHQNDPLGAAVALEVIRTIGDEALIERSRDIATILSAGLEDIRARTGAIREVRARGLMAAVELEAGDERPSAGDVQRELLRRGFIVARRPDLGVLRIDPPLTVERADVEAFLRVFEDVLAGE